MKRVPWPIVIDASVAVKILMPEDLSDRAIALASRLACDPAAIACSPDLFLAECANVLRTWARSMLMTPGDASAAFDVLAGLPIAMVPTSDVAREALDIALGFDVTAYDACYAALARRVGGLLVTADAALVRKLGKSRGPGRIRVVHLSDLPARWSGRRGHHRFWRRGTAGCRACSRRSRAGRGT